ncbi:ArsR/SmtB family transcription factor [Deinococcus aestuarii]|uniref:ArsR/SmtB family transcription factor n=1 Tax=Deinococcus aestuarii TaxID=2774531 RepID=UPI001C0BC23A|nr:helix-turn-helix domain-containing protein [Deinococcus aestuarii]
MDRAVLSNGVLHVRDPRAAPRVMSGWEMRYLAPFLGREATMSQAARELGVSVSRLHYQVRKLQGEGLLRVSRVERRGRRELKVYRAVADRLFIPFDLMSLESVETALLAADQPWLTLFLRSLAQVWRENPGTWGMRLERTASGHVRAHVVPDPHSEEGLEEERLPALFLGGWVTDLHLDFEDARALRRDLGEVLERYLQRGGAGRYLLQLRLAPLPGDVPGLPNVTMR